MSSPDAPYDSPEIAAFREVVRDKAPGPHFYATLLGLETFETLDFTIEPADLRVCFDPSQLHQVVWNLCQNACRHGVGGGCDASFVLFVG